MSPTTSRQRQEREAARRRAQEVALAQAHRRAARRRGLIGIGVVAGVILAVVVVLRGAADQRDRRAASSSTAAAPSTTGPGPARPAASLPTVAPGAVLAGPPPCPPLDGSAPRTTQFGAPPPECLDPALDYTAHLITSKGRIVVELQEREYPGPVNNFVFLAGYHYYDGLPVTFIRRGGWAEVADPVNADGSRGPGYQQPATGKGQAPSYGALFVGLTARGGTTGGGLTLAMPGNENVNIAPDTSPLGIITDARAARGDTDMTVQIGINNAAAASGAPAEVVTIDRVDIRTCPRGAQCPEPLLPD